MRATNNMNIQSIDGSTYMTIITIGFYWGAVILGTVALQALAGVCAIAAAVSTVAYNCFKFYRDYKEMNKKE